MKTEFYFWNPMIAKISRLTVTPTSHILSRKYPFNQRIFFWKKHNNKASKKGAAKGKERIQSNLKLGYFSCCFLKKKNQEYWKKTWLALDLRRLRNTRCDCTYNGFSFIFFYFLKGKSADFASKIKSTFWYDLAVYSNQEMHLLHVL